MSDSKIATSIIKLVNNSAKLVGKLQNGVNVILWGNANKATNQTVKYDTTTNSLKYTGNPTIAVPPKSGNLLESGLFNALDALNGVDLCSILTYLTDNIHTKRNPRPPKPWNTTQTLLYTLQDQAGLVKEAIDKHTAYPNVLIGSYFGTGPNPLTPPPPPTTENTTAIAAETANPQNPPPGEGGSNVAKYNMYFLLQFIRDTFTFVSDPNSPLFTAEDKTLLTTVPGLGGNLNFIDDFIGTIDKYSDYRQISNTELVTLQSKTNKIRSACVTIQGLDFQNALSLAGNFLQTDIRAQIQKLNKFVDATKIIPTLKGINNSLRTFIRQAKQVQGILTLGQFLIKLALVFAKIFKFIQGLFIVNPYPLIFATGGVQTVFQNASEAAKTETNGIIRLLKAINALLSVLLVFIRYLLTNANELLSRLEILLANLEGCEAVKNSDVVAELKQTQADLVALRDQLATYITQYDSKTNANTAMFGKYDIRVVDEEVTDPSIRNKRRRGIALDVDSQIVAQSDLTFATNTAVIIAEVQQKLIALHLVPSNMGQIDAANLAVIAESVNYLESNDVVDNNLNPDLTVLGQSSVEQTANIQEFIAKVPGGPKFKQDSKKIQAGFNDMAKKEVKTQADAAGGSTGTQINQQTAGQLTTISGSVSMLTDKPVEKKETIKPTTPSNPIDRLFGRNRSSGGNSNSQPLK
jgi:hypothetical protein